MCFYCCSVLFHHRLGDIKRKLETTNSKYVVVKDVAMRPPDQQLKWHLPSGFKYAFLIRDPHLVYNSYRKAKYEDLKKHRKLAGDALDENKFDIAKHDCSRKVHNFFKYLHNIWGHVRETVDPDPLVINTRELRDNPKRALRHFCEHTGLPYQDSLLQWDASNEVVKSWNAVGDSILFSVNSFFHTAVTSTEFLPAKDPPPRDQLTDDVIRLVDAALPFYNDMNQHRFRWGHISPKCWGMHGRTLWQFSF